MVYTGLFFKMEHSMHRLFLGLITLLFQAQVVFADFSIAELKQAITTGIPKELPQALPYDSNSKKCAPLLPDRATCEAGT